MKINLKKLPVINLDEAEIKKLRKEGARVKVNKLNDVIQTTDCEYWIDQQIRLEINYQTPTGRDRAKTIDEWYAYIDMTAKWQLRELKKRGYKNITVKPIALVKKLTKVPDYDNL